jgi:hypothetical protein
MRLTGPTFDQLTTTILISNSKETHLSSTNPLVYYNIVYFTSIRMFFHTNYQKKYRGLTKWIEN